VTRRAALLLLAGIASVVAAAFVDRRRLWLTLERFLAPRIDRSSQPGRLSRREMDAVLAYAEVLVSDTVLSGAARAGLEDYVTDRSEHEPGYCALYRLAVDVLDEAAGGDFAARPPDERRRAVHRRHLDQYDVRARHWFWPGDRRSLTVRALAARDLMTGYFLSPPGWALVGYDAFPGRCRDLSDYTRAG
jgi:hypothetical protein